MKLPIPFFLYLTSVGLLGSAGYTFYKAWPQLQRDAGTRSSSDGQDAGHKGLAMGKVSSPGARDWNYVRQPSWWQTLKTVNLTGKEPPKTVDPTQPVVSAQAPVVNEQPVAEIIELVSLMYDPDKKGQGGQTHVTIRYKPSSGVQPPEWYVREVQGVTQGPLARPGMDVAAQPVQPARGGSRPPQGQRPGPTTPMPASNVGRETLQRVFVEGDGSPRQVNRLWPPFERIRLVRVSPDAQVAYFVRDPLPAPPPKEGEPPAPAPAPVEEPLRKSMLGLSQDLLEAIDKLQGSELAARSREPAPSAGGAGTAWIDNPEGETRQVGNTWHVGRNDERMFAENPDKLLGSFEADSYVSRSSNLRGVRIKNVAPETARRYGVSAGEVIVAVNGEPVATKSDAMAVGKRQYNRGVRTFVVKFLSSGGQYVERTYTAPDRKN